LEFGVPVLEGRLVEGALGQHERAEACFGEFVNLFFGLQEVLLAGFEEGLDGGVGALGVEVDFVGIGIADEDGHAFAVGVELDEGQFLVADYLDLAAVALGHINVLVLLSEEFSAVGLGEVDEGELVRRGRVVDQFALLLLNVDVVAERDQSQSFI
jgi:hypothetical protein